MSKPLTILLAGAAVTVVVLVAVVAGLWSASSSASDSTDVGTVVSGTGVPE